VGPTYKQEDHEERAHVQSGIEAEGTYRVECGKQSWKRDREDSRPEQASGDRETHSDFSVRQREDFGTVRERHRAFAGRVEGGEQEHEERNEPQTRVVALRDVETETGTEKRPCHLGEREEQQSPPSVRVDGEDGGPREDEVHQAETQRSHQGLLCGRTGLAEDGGGVESWEELDRRAGAGGDFRVPANR